MKCYKLSIEDLFLFAFVAAGLHAGVIFCIALIVTILINAGVV